MGAHVSPTLVGAAVPVKHTSCWTALAAPVACMLNHTAPDVVRL